MKKYSIRENEAFIFASFERPFVSALLGPRRVGKTTLLNHYMRLKHKRKWVTLNMDVLAQRNRVQKEELQVMIEQEALQKIGGPEKIWVFIDEAQKCPELFDQIKFLYDTYKGLNHIKFILTGSAHLNLHKLTAESLAGRVELLNLREFNLKEVLHLQNPKLPLKGDSALSSLFTKIDCEELQRLAYELQPFEKLFQKALDHHLSFGGLPEVIEEPEDALKLKYLGDYLGTWLEKDIRAIDSISDLNLFQNLMKISAELTGNLRDDNQILAALHCSRNTLSKYRAYLLAALQYREIYPFIGSSVKRFVKSPKGYLVNNGLINYLTGIYQLPLLKNTGLIGHRFENWFLNEVLSFMDSQVEQCHVTFWKAASGTEVDFVVSVGAKIIPFEVTYDSSATKKIKNLKRFMEQTPKAECGVVCYNGPFSFNRESRIFFLPAWMV